MCGRQHIMGADELYISCPVVGEFYVVYSLTVLLLTLWRSTALRNESKSQDIFILSHMGVELSTNTPHRWLSVTCMELAFIHSFIQKTNSEAQSSLHFIFSWPPTVSADIKNSFIGE